MDLIDDDGLIGNVQSVIKSTAKTATNLKLGLAKKQFTPEDLFDLFGLFFIDEKDLPNIEIFVFELLKELKRQGAYGIISKKIAQSLAAFLKVSPNSAFNSAAFRTLVSESWRRLDLEALKAILEVTGLRLETDE